MDPLIKNYDPDNSLFIIDGHSMIYRAYYAFIRNPLVNSKGFNTSGVFGFLRMLFRLMKRFSPKRLLVSFDTGKPNFRHALFKEYKSTRKKMPDDLIPQVPYIKKITALLGIPQVEIEDYESDDAIAGLARAAKKHGMTSYIITKDKDLLQTVEEKIYVLQPESTKEGEDFILMDNGKIRELYHIPPGQLIDYFALTGDASDNIPGVKGIGPKNALDLIRQFKSIDGLYADLKSVKNPRLKSILEKGKDSAFLSRRLVQLSADIPLPVKITDLLIKEPDRDAVIALFSELEIKTLLKDLNWLDNLSRTKRYEIVDTEEKFRAFLKEAMRHKEMAVDTETDSESPLRAHLAGLSFSFEENTGYYIPVGHAAMLGTAQLALESILPGLKALLESTKHAFVGQNIKYDHLVLQRHGMKIRNIHFDTMVASYLINPTKTRHNLDELALTHLGYKTITFKEVLGKKKNFSEVPIDRAADYSIEDADITFRLYRLLDKKIAEMNLSGLYHRIDMPLIRILADMESAGIRIDTKKLAELDGIITKKLLGLTEKIHREAGEVFNINSTKQLAAILFEKMKLKPPKKIKTGLSTDIDVLEELKPLHPVAGLLIEYRTLSKLKSTYIDTLPAMIDPRTGRLHTSFSQTTTATGRLSSSDPNLQNIPIRDELGRQIRRAFVAEPGNELLSADYSQIELRILAHISGDEVLTSAFCSGQDIHTRTIMEIYRIGEDQVTPDLRRTAKVINYGIIYGMGAFGLSKALNIAVREAQEFIDNYFLKYKGIRDYVERIKTEIAQNGFVENLFGRRRYLPAMAQYSPQQKGFVLRTAINTPIQGTAADLIKLAMIEIDAAFKKENLKSRMLLQVHDELIFEVAPGEKEKVGRIVREGMENVHKFSVPITAELNFGGNWGEAHA